MKRIPINNNGVLYGYCYINEKNIVNTLYNNEHSMYKDHFADNMRINARMLKKREKFFFDEPITRYSARNQLDNEKFLSKGKSLIIE